MPKMAAKTFLRALNLLNFRMAAPAMPATVFLNRIIDSLRVLDRCVLFIRLCFFGSLLRIEHELHLPYHRH